MISQRLNYANNNNGEEEEKSTTDINKKYDYTTYFGSYNVNDNEAN